jgi:hypothetical protein
MTTMYAAQANGPANVMAAARALAFRPCSRPWSPIALGTTVDVKHGRPRRTEVST